MLAPNYGNFSPSPVTSCSTDSNLSGRQIAPADYPYRHREGNSDAHIKASLTGASVSVPFSGASPALGTWQGIYLMEFDGPRERRVLVTVI